MSLAAALETANGAPPLWLDVRFDAAGRALRCSGNTIVCHLRDQSGIDATHAIAARIAEMPAGNCYAFTAPESWHMTVFNGLLHEADRARVADGFWPSELPTGASDAEADRFMIDAMATVRPPDKPVTMVASGFGGISQQGLGIALTPASPTDSASIRAYRDRLAEATGLTARPGHDDYKFHLTLGYLIAWPTVEDAVRFDQALRSLSAELPNLFPPFHLGPPEICLFDHMNEFRVQTTVTSAEAAISTV